MLLTYMQAPHLCCTDIGNYANSSSTLAMNTLATCVRVRTPDYHPPTNMHYIPNVSTTFDTHSHTRETASNA